MSAAWKPPPIGGCEWGDERYDEDCGVRDWTLRLGIVGLRVMLFDPDPDPDEPEPDEPESDRYGLQVTYLGKVVELDDDWTFFGPTYESVLEQLRERMVPLRPLLQLWWPEAKEPA